jgi:arginine decarboxylase
VLIDRNEDGELSTELFASEQTSESMMKILGYEEAQAPKRQKPTKLKVTGSI